MSETAAHARLNSPCPTRRLPEDHSLSQKIRAGSPGSNGKQLDLSELGVFDRIDRELDESSDLEQVTEVCRRWALERTDSQVCRLYLFDDEAPWTGWGTTAGKTEASSLQGSFFRDRSSASPTLNCQQLAQAVESGEALRIFPQAGEPARLAVPLKRAGRTMGLLLVARDRPYGEADERFLERLALHAGAFIENSHLQQALFSANQARSKFVSVVTHELRIPMTSIKGYADLMRQGLAGPLTDQQQQFLDVIQKNVERMSALVSDLADISRLETGQARLECTAISALKCVDEAIQGMLPKFEAKGQSLQVNVQPGLPDVMADPHRVVQILTNLLGNALKYTPPQGRIDVSLSVEGASVRLSVRDTGLGISEEDLPFIFADFFRSESADVREQDGWGLGLGVTRRLVELMGGTIGVESVLGQGSAFWFTLPAVAAAR